MDWRYFGYWPVWKDGKKVWVPKDAEAFDKDRKDQNLGWDDYDAFGKAYWDKDLND